MSDLRAVNARLRQVVADKDELIAAQEGLLGAQVEQLSNQDQRLRRRSAGNATRIWAVPSNSAMGGRQVWDVLPAALEKAHYLLPRRRCGCGTVTTSAAPFGQAGTVSYGPNLGRRGDRAGQRGQRAGGADRDG